MRKALLDLWRRESWTVRAALAIGVILVALSILSAVLVLAIGILGGGWRFTELLDDLSTLALVGLGFGYVYWRRRAQDAEQPATTRDHSVHFHGPVTLADIESWREQQSKFLGLRDL